MMRAITFDQGAVSRRDNGAITRQREGGVMVAITVNATTRYAGVKDQTGRQTGPPAPVMTRLGVATLVLQAPPSIPRRLNSPSAQKLPVRQAGILLSV
jgi:hypothetical protein